MTELRSKSLLYLSKVDTVINNNQPLLNGNHENHQVLLQIFEDNT